MPYQYTFQQLKKSTRWLMPPLLGGIFYLMMYISSNFEGEQFSWIVYSIVVLLLYIFDSISGWFLKTRIKKSALDLRGFLLSVLLVMLANVVISSGLKQLAIVLQNQHDRISLRHLSVYMAEGLLFGLILSGRHFIVHYIKAWQEEARKVEAITKEHVQAQLKALKHQVNPHFLFNNFNTLYGLIHEDVDRASDFLLELSDFYRYMLTHSEEPLVSLQQELQAGRHFNFLLKNRFENAYTYQEEIAEADQYLIPPFSLLSLIENVVKHNRIDEQHPLWCKTYIEDHELVIQNNIQPKVQKPESHGIGLRNLQEQYRLLCGKEVRIQATNGLFEVRLPLLSTETKALQPNAEMTES